MECNTFQWNIHETEDTGKCKRYHKDFNPRFEFVTGFSNHPAIRERSHNRVVDRIPNLHEQQKGSHQDGIDAHVLRPENGERAFQREAHVTAEVA